MRIIIPTVCLCLIACSAFAERQVSYEDYNRIHRIARKQYDRLIHQRRAWKTLGRSVDGRKILYGEIGSGKKTTLVIGGLHGDEPAGVLVAMRLARAVRANPSLLKNRLLIVPCLNPDGLARKTRTNARGVDINRNFPTRTWSSEFGKDHNNSGLFPASEPETVLISNLIELKRPDMIIQIHQPFNTLYPEEGFPSLLMERMSLISDLPVSNDVGYRTPGSLASIRETLGFHTDMVTLELCPIDEEPHYGKVIMAILEAVND
ncbi:MAG TPA: DUF2817 domain-containing protein [Spirochaetota bacterium]|nr:DUF2817 domain-containing protein [Spirochaetota bacterium]